MKRVLAIGIYLVGFGVHLFLVYALANPYFRLLTRQSWG
jgi:hypothetical protein